MVSVYCHVFHNSVQRFQTQNKSVANTFKVISGYFKQNKEKQENIVNTQRYTSVDVMFKLFLIPRT